LAHDTPVEFNELIIYEVFPRAYQDGFKGLIADLERIKNIGINAIWLMPIHPTGVKRRKGTLGSPYSIKDYYEIDTDIGTKEDFRELINKSHHFGIKVLMDMVLNHTSPDSVLVQKHPEWFFKDDKGHPAPKNPDWEDVVDLDYSNRDLWNYMINMMKYWVEEFDVDGFRCDVAGLVPLEFWIEAREQLNSIKKLIWISETHDPYMYQAFDITYDYDGYYKLKDYLRGQIPLREYVGYMKMQEQIYPRNYIKLRFLENHDQDRIAFLVKDDLKLRNLTVYLFTVKGVPLIYNGQEFKLEEKPDIFNEYKIPWEKGDKGWSKFYEKLCSIRQSSNLLKRGDIKFVDNSQPQNAVTFVRYFRSINRYIVVILPLDKNLSSLRVRFSGILQSSTRYHAKNLLNDEILSFYLNDVCETNFENLTEPLILSFYG
jgi:alpha-amylase